MNYKKITLPDNLHPIAEKYIKAVINFLISNEKLNAVDLGSIYILADSYSQYLKASERVEAEGMTVPGSRSSLIPHPCIKIAKDAKSVCLNVMAEMGLTLKSRSKLTNMDGEDKETSPLNDFIKSMR